ncbi:MAG: tetratricopeptide repeat protein [Bacteroidetes bacterium]|nr:tetratricopeptide repeat protein [Bacteroidota bacterium]
MAEKKTEKTRTEIISVFISRNRITLLIILGIIIIAVVAFGITVSALNKQLDKKTAQVEVFHDEYANWVNNTAELTEEESQNVYLKLQDDLSQFIDSTRKGYPELRALFTLASVEYHKESYKSAVDLFIQVFEDYPESHLAASSAMNAAVCYELLGDQDNAVKYYQMVYENYGDRSSEAPHAKFCIGRIYEVMGEADNAIESYRELSTEYPNSEWAKLAVSRLIALE